MKLAIPLIECLFFSTNKFSLYGATYDSCQGERDQTPRDISLEPIPEAIRLLDNAHLLNSTIDP